ncbi:MAG TPA: tetratricopeptide repeat protein, partial [Dictyoglomaceae bacterium]|nr:tetratricopeptide repeat protein [Dictyoglomaceae bacterium]
SQSYKYLESKDLNSAEKVLRDILEKYPNNTELWISLGIILEEENKPKESEDCFNKAKNLCKDDIEFYLARAIEYTKVNKIEDAEKDLKKVLSIEKDNAEALYLLAGIYEEKGNINEAIKLYKRIEELGDKVDPQILVMSKVRMGVLLQRLPLELEQN